MPRTETPLLTVVIPVHGQALLTKSILARLIADPELEAAEIVVVDDASPDDTREVLASFDDRVHAIELDRNVGFAAACNAGARAASPGSSALLFLNNDMAPTRGWLSELRTYAATHEQAGIVGSKLLFPNDTVQHAGVVICEDRVPRHVYAGFPADHPAVCHSRRFQVVTGGCALVRRELFDALGGFDEAFRNGYEDVDLCLRAGAAGHEVHYCHTSVLYHLESMSRVATPGENTNRSLYLERWGATIYPDEFATYIGDGLIEVENRSTYPLRLRISPLLAIIDEEGRDRIADRLLVERSSLTLRLLRENIRLRVRLGEIPEPGADGED